jgi:hypothetical protein
MDNGIVIRPTGAWAALQSFDAVVYKGAIDCSGNPNYPAAGAGDLYIVSVSGKIGGASGTSVTSGALLICKDDATGAGTQAAVGDHWDIVASAIDYGNVTITGGTITGITDLAVADGGTGRSSFTENGVLYGNTTSGLLVTAAGTEGQILRAGATGAPAFSTATYPATTTVNQLLYSSATNAIEGITTAASGILITSAAGVPSIGVDIPTGVTIGGGYIYRAGGTDVPATDGGTGLSAITDHGIMLGSGTGAVTALAAGATGEVLIGQTDADPAWSSSPSFTQPFLLQSSSASQGIANASNAQVLTFSTDTYHSAITRTSQSRFTITKAGTYLITFSGLADCTAEDNKHIEIWMRVNGSDIAASNTRVQIPTVNIEMTVAVNFLQTFAADDYFELWTSGDSTAVRWVATAAGTNPTRPASPSIILTANWISG